MASQLSLPRLPKLSLGLPKLSLGRSSGGRDVVGLDIEPGFVTAATASVNGCVRISHAVGMPLDIDVVRDGEVLDAVALSDTLRELFHDSHLGRSVRIGLANQRTVLRTLDLPPIEDRKELASAVRFQAEDQVPMPLQNAVLDFHPLGIVDTPAGPRQRVVLVAAQRDMVERLMDAARAAGLRPVGVDLAAFAMIRALHRHEVDGPERLVYLAVGGLTNMAIADGTTCRFTRVLGGGIEPMAISIAARREIPLTDARQLVLSVGLTQPSRPAAAPRRPVVLDPVNVSPEDAYELQMRAIENVPAADPDDDVRSVVANGVREIAGEVRNSLDFQRAQDDGAPAAAVVLSGPALTIPGFTGALEGELGLPVRAGTVEGAEESSFGLLAAERMTIAAGLAVEQVPA